MFQGIGLNLNQFKIQGGTQHFRRAPRASPRKSPLEMFISRTAPGVYIMKNNTLLPCGMIFQKWGRENLVNEIREFTLLCPLIKVFHRFSNLFISFTHIIIKKYYSNFGSSR